MSEMLLLDRRTKELVENYVPKAEVLDNLAGFFSIFSDNTRLKILSALSITELCVTDLSRVLRLNQTTVSHQLRLLKNTGVLRTKRHGKIIFYSMKSDLVNDVMLKGVEFLGF